MRLTKWSENHKVIDNRKPASVKNIRLLTTFSYYKLLYKSIFLNHVVDVSAFSLMFKKLSIASSMTSYGIL